MGTSVIFMEHDPENAIPAGTYEPSTEDGKYIISLQEETLKEPEILISTLAHEIAHVKLLGEQRMEENDELLTDFCSAFFGFGVLSANTAFQFIRQTDRWGYQAFGYTLLEEWGYALALLAFVREEDNPEWASYLNETVRHDFQKSLDYMIEHEDEIFTSNEDE